MPTVDRNNQYFYGTSHDHNRAIMQNMVDNSAERGRQLRESGECDCVAQPIAAILCGPLCFPCSVIRLVGYCTGKFDPSNYIGLDNCLMKERGYQDLGYDQSPQTGTGYSKKCLDIMSIFATTSLAIGIPILITSSKSAAATTHAPRALSYALLESTLTPPTDPISNVLHPKKIV